jgi:hypothetical protein
VPASQDGSSTRATSLALAAYLKVPARPARSRRRGSGREARSETVCHWFAKSPCIPGNPRASLFAPPPENRPIRRAFFDLPKTQLLIAMQKVEGSSPFRRL